MKADLFSAPRKMCLKMQLVNNEEFEVMKHCELTHCSWWHFAGHAINRQLRVCSPVCSVDNLLTADYSDGE